MAVKLFGTDGVRGRANQSPMTAEMALRIGAAVGRYFRNDGRNVHRVLIGKDTRLSGYMFENALTAGLTSTGMNALLVGPIPTPAVGLLTVSMRADLGIMISASHNPAEDNGIKFFGPDGFKLSDEAEADIEKLIIKGVEPAQAGNIGRAKRVDDGRFRYGERLKAALPAGIRLDGLKIVVDCANGAAHRVAPEILWELGANVIPLGVTPNGRNINEGCGSTHPAATQAEVLLRKADLGICLDGDADRVILVDETGAIADGDQILALFARQWKAQGRLAKDSLVATVMSNLGLERFLTGHQIALERTKVGDRYVVAHMRQGGFNLGGEQSGHIVMTDHATTGDGLLAALQFLAELVRSGKKASALCHLFDPVPQLLRNVRISDTERALGASGVKAAIEDAERALQDRGRLLIRKSGTEPMVRVMGECDDRDLLENAVGQIVEALSGEKV